MEEVDAIILVSLRQVGTDVPDTQTSLKGWPCMAARLRARLGVNPKIFVAIQA
jgi:hypothetical protein